MATSKSHRLPHFTFPQQQHSGFVSPTTPPRLSLHDTPPTSPCSELSREPKRRVSRPEPLRTATSPPESPVRDRAYTMGNNTDMKTLHDSGVITPPPTPTHSKNNSASSFRSTTSLHRGDSITSTLSRRRGASMDASEHARQHCAQDVSARSDGLRNWGEVGFWMLEQCVPSHAFVA